MDARFALAALKVAITRRRSRPGCIHHSYRGSQYASGIYQALLAYYDLVDSMSRRGNPYDNAKAESFMKTLKVEAVHPMAFETFDEAAEQLPTMFTINAACTPRSATSAPCSSRSNISGLWSNQNFDPVRLQEPTPHRLPILLPF